MRAVLTARAGGPEVLAVGDAADPSAGPGQVVVDVAFAGINFLDVAQRRRGLGPVLGNEGAGVVSDLGPDVADVRVGDRVAWVLARGSYAERQAVSAADLVPVPPDVSLEQAAALLQGITAHYLVTDAASAHAGDTVVVHAAAGGVGRVLTALAVARGARILAVVGSPSKVEVARQAGAHDVLVRDAADLPTWARERTGGEGAQIVYDGVGAATAEASLRSLSTRGRLVLFGQASGQPGPIDPALLADLGSLSVTQTRLSSFLRTRAELLTRADALFAALRDHRVALQIRTLPLAEASRAHRDLESGMTTGKLVLRVDAPATVSHSIANIGRGSR